MSAPQRKGRAGDPGGRGRNLPPAAPRGRGRGRIPAGGEKKRDEVNVSTREYAGGEPRKASSGSLIQTHGSSRRGSGEMTGPVSREGWIAFILALGVDIVSLSRY